MHRFTYKLITISLIVGAALVVCLGGFAARFAYEYVDATAWINHTTEAIGAIRSTRSLLGLPGNFPADGAVGRVRIAASLDQLNRVAALTIDNPNQQANIREFRSLLPAVIPGDRAAVPPEAISTAYSTLERMQSEEYRLLEQRIQKQTQATRSASIAVTALCLALLLLGGFTAYIAQAEFRRREVTERTLLNEKQQLESYTRELALVSAGSELIQSARDESYVHEAVAGVLRDLLPGSHGFFALISPSNDLVEVSSHWGDSALPCPFAPGDCVALQLGRAVHRGGSLLQVNCKQSCSPKGDYLCMPLRGSNGHLGILHAESPQPLNTERANAVSLFAAQVALGLTNLRMREALRSQTVRDSLTGLFNRRYFDETLKRELAGFRRNGIPLSVLMMDVDHFKRFNDTHGHAAGDDALRTFSRLMRTAFRENDVACRYGGEEFAVILNGAGLADAYQKAESFRKLVEETELTSDGHAIGRMSTSVGLACCNEFGTLDDIVKAADAALYHAKHTGRNTIWACSAVEGALPSIMPHFARIAATEPGTDSDEALTWVMPAAPAAMRESKNFPPSA